LQTARKIVETWQCIAIADHDIQRQHQAELSLHGDELARRLERHRTHLARLAVLRDERLGRDHPHDRIKGTPGPVAQQGAHQPARLGQPAIRRRQRQHIVRFGDQ
jgi:hypothetical protein